MLTAITPGRIITPGHPYYQNLPEAHEQLSCTCGVRADVLIMVPGHRLDRCRPCYQRLAPFLDPAVKLIFVGTCLAGVTIREVRHWYS